MRRWLLLSTVLVQLACPTAAPLAPTGSPAPCTSFGAKCKTPTGPLGVCDSIPCAAGAQAPCFKCMPQH